MSTDTPDLPSSRESLGVHDDERSSLIESYGFVDGGVPEGLKDLCDLIWRASGADGLDIVVAGRSNAVLTSGGVREPVVATAPIAADAGVTFAEVRLRSSAPVDTDVLDRSVRSIAALCDLQVTRDRVFDLEEGQARAEDEMARASAQIVHDLNNPLAAVSMCLEIAREQVPDDGLLASLLDRASGSAEKMKRMVVSLSEYGQSTVPGATDLAVEVPLLVSQFAPLLDETVVVAEGLPTVSVSPGEVRSVLTALWENSVKFAREESDLVISVGAEPSDLGWRIWVEDNGHGFADEDAERIFTPTVRLDKRIPGLGLGLSTVRRIVTAAGGRVGARPSPAGGAHVWFEVPGTVLPPAR